MYLYRTVLYLTGNGVVAHDRACHQLEEHGEIQQISEVIFLRPCLFAVNIDHVGYGLEGVERNSYWQVEIRHRQAERQQSVYAVNYHSAVLEHTKY